MNISATNDYYKLQNSFYARPIILLTNFHYNYKAAVTCTCTVTVLFFRSMSSVINL